MNKKRLWNSLSLLLALGLLMPEQASSAPISLPISLSGAGATWTDVGKVNFGVGSGVEDAGIGGQSDAFDSALTLSINGSDVLYPTAADLTGSTITTSPAATGVFRTVGEYFASQNHPVLRAVFSITNTDSGDASATVSLQTNLGADNDSMVLDSSSNDTTFSTVDSWVVMDDATATGDPATTHILYGAGAIETTTVASNTVFNGFGTEGVRGDFELNIGAGKTQRLMFFLRLDTNGTDASNFAGTWTNLSTLDAAGLLAGLDSAVKDEIVNWGVVPEPGTLSLMLLGMSAISRGRRRTSC